MQIGLNGVKLTMAQSPDFRYAGFYSITWPAFLSTFYKIALILQGTLAVWKYTTGV